MKSLETRDFAPHTVRTGWNEGNNRFSMVVLFGLQHLQGNQQPYFGVTVDGIENGRWSFGGCCHDLVIEHFPELADIVALHLSDMDGSPMHAVSNGYYWAAGVVDMGEQYHGGSGEFGKSAKECARILAEHLRITEPEAIKLAGATYKIFKRNGKDAAKRSFEEYVNAQRPRWKAEAIAVIRKYNLGIYGDIHKTPAEVAATL